MVLFELVMRELPWQELETEHQIMFAVTVKELTPQMPEDQVQPALLALMKSCWAMDPTIRPSFAAVMEQLAQLDGIHPIKVIPQQASANLVLPTNDQHMSVQSYTAETSTIGGPNTAQHLTNFSYIATTATAGPSTAGGLNTRTTPGSDGSATAPPSKVVHPISK
jgi:hypothetical protein